MTPNRETDEEMQARKAEIVLNALHYRNQHDPLEVGGTTRGKLPTARVRFVFRYDVLRDMGVLDDGQCKDADSFVIRNNAALRICEARISQIYGGEAHGLIMDAISDEDKTLADQYHELIRKLPRDPFNLVMLTCQNLTAHEDMETLKSSLFAIAPRIESAFGLLHDAMDEILACKEL